MELIRGWKAESGKAQKRRFPIGNKGVRKEKYVSVLKDEIRKENISFKFN